MAKTYHKVVYKPESKSTDVFQVIVDAHEYKKWKDGDKSIPLVEVVDAMKVFHTGQGAQGIMSQPSKQQLDATFGSTKVDDAVLFILENGELLAATAKDGYSTTNDSKQGHNSTSAGSGGGGQGGR